MVEIGCLVVGIEGIHLGRDGDAASGIDRTAGEYVVDRRATAAFIPAAFVLIGSGRAAPKEIFWKLHLHDYLSFPIGFTEWSASGLRA